MRMSGEDLILKLKTYGPKVASKALQEDSGSFMEKKLFFILQRLDCVDPWNHFKDVVNEMWVKVIEDFNKCYEGVKEADYKYPRPWLKSIGNHCAIDHWKKERKDSIVVYCESDEVLDDNICQHSNLHQFIVGIPIEELIYRKEIFKQLRGFIKSLPQKERSVLALRLKGYSFKLIARSLGINPDYARVIMWKITRKLRLEVVRLNGGRI